MEKKNISRRDPPKKTVTSGYNAPRPGNDSINVDRALDMSIRLIVVRRTNFDYCRSSTGCKRSSQNKQYVSE